MTAIQIKDGYIAMSTPEGDAWYSIMSKKSNMSCVTQYSLKGGVTQPFEYVDITLSKKRLSSVAPALIDNIIPGRSLLSINAYGGGWFIVSKAKLDGKGQNREYNIQAYAVPQLYKVCNLNRTLTGTAYPPFEMIQQILNDPMYGLDGENTLGLKIRNVITNFQYLFTEDKLEIGESGTPTYYNNQWINPSQINFPANTTNVWRVLQICSWHLGCKLWFSGNTAYLIDFKQKVGKNSGIAISDYNSLPLHQNNLPTASSLLGDVDLGDEGTDTIQNKIYVTYGTSSTPTSAQDTESITKYGERETRISIPEFGTSSQDAQWLAQRLIEYRSEPQNSMGIRVKELDRAKWEPHFDDVSRASSIKDVADDVLLQNRSFMNNDEKLQLLYLSEYTRYYPEGYSEYWWGKVDNADLTQTMSNIQKE